MIKIDTKKACWVLTDYKIGSNMQAIALAESMRLDVKEINIEYNLLANLPNFVHYFPFWQVRSPNLKKMLQNEKPDFLISASRKTAMVSNMIKKIYPQINNIHILNPQLPGNFFNYVILPKHDKNTDTKNNNIIRIVGSLCNIHSRINNSWESFELNYQSSMKEKYIGVLVGGDTKGFSFNQFNSIEFVTMLKNLSNSMKMKLFITLSRRTPKVLKEALKLMNNSVIEIYEPENLGLNPYPALLKNAKLVISTCDSISMCSEVVSYGKPLYLYIPDGFKSSKHLTFAGQLEELGVAKILKNTENLLQEYNYTPLNECNRVAEYILSR